MTPLLVVRDLAVHFAERRTPIDWALRRGIETLKAVDGVDLMLEQGEVVGLVGESGCGKSTVARAIVGLETPAAGTIRFRGEELPPERTKESKRHIQMVFQDPASALDPLMTVEQMLTELLLVHELVPKSRVRERCRELVEMVEMPPRYLGARPRALSGGQRQRISIARALAVEPELLIADESVAALDVSVQAAIINLLLALRDRLGLTLLIISHDLAVIRNMCDRIAVMYLGRIVERASAAQIFADARHPYTRALSEAVPRIEVEREIGAAVLKGEPPSPLDLPSGCRFHPRCPIVQDRCREEEPVSIRIGDRTAECFYAFGADEISAADEQIGELSGTD